MIRLTFDNSVRNDAFDKVDRHRGDPKMEARVICAIKLRELYEKNPELIEITCNDGEQFEPPEGGDTFKRTRGVGIWELRGFSEYGEVARVGDEHAPILERIREIMRPARDSVSSMKDYAVLCEHVVVGRDIFVSADEPKHLNKAPQLKELDIIVKSAAETVDYLEQQYGFDFSGVTETR